MPRPRRAPAQARHTWAAPLASATAACFLLLPIPSLCALRHYGFDDAAALGAPSTPSAPHVFPHSGGSDGVAAFRSGARGGVRPGGGYLELRAGGHVRLGDADHWQVGTDFSVTAWVRPRVDDGVAAALFSLGGAGSRSACAWSPDEDAYVLPGRVPTANSTADTVAVCRERCEADEACTAAAYDTQVGMCSLYDCTPTVGVRHCEITNTTHPAVGRYVLSRCERASSAMTAYVTGEGTVGLLWNGAACELPGTIAENEWSLVSVAVSASASAESGLVRVSRLSPGVQEASCYSASWLHAAGIPVRSGDHAVLGVDLSRRYAAFSGDVDDVTVSLAGADVGALTKRVAVSAGVVLERTFDEAAGDEAGDVEVSVGGGVRGGSLRVNMRSDHPTDAAYAVSDGLAAMGAVAELSICAWVKPVCFGGPAALGCGMPWSVRNPATGERVLSLRLLETGDAEHTVLDSVVSTAEPSYIGCFAAADRGWLRGSWGGELSGATKTIDGCAGLCTKKYFLMQGHERGCLCTNTHPSVVMAKAPDGKCRLSCPGETSRAKPSSCGSDLSEGYVAGYTHTVASRYLLGEYSTKCHADATDVGTEAECAGAAAKLGLFNTTVGRLGIEDRADPPSNYPRGCLYDEMNARLYWNPDGDPYLEVAADKVAYRRVCRVTQNRVWKEGRWQWYCATLDAEGVHRLYVDGSPAWEGRRRLEEGGGGGRGFAFRDGFVLEVGGGGRGFATQFRGEVDGLRVSRRAEPAALEGAQLWRLQDLNRVYHTELLSRLDTGVVEWETPVTGEVSAYVAASVDLRDSLLSWRVRHTGSYVDMDLIVSSSPLVNYSHALRLQNGLLATYRQQIGNGTTQLLLRNYNNLNPTAYAGNCPAVRVSASSTANYSEGAHAVRRADQQPWRPDPASSRHEGWLRFDYEQHVEVTGVYVRAWRDVTAFASAMLEASDDGGATWRSVRSLAAAASFETQFFTGWGSLRARHWRLNMNRPRYTDGLAIDYVAMQIAGFSAPCGEPNADCRYPHGGQGYAIGGNATLLESLTSAGDRYGCRDACDDEAACDAFAYHADSATCQLAQGVGLVGLNRTTGWVAFAGKTGCTQTTAAPSSDSQPVDTTLLHHPPSGRSVVKAGQTAKARGGALQLAEAMGSVEVGVRCSDENGTADGLPNRVRGTYPTLALCEAFCGTTYACHYCSPSFCTPGANGTACSYAPLRFCDVVEAVPDHTPQTRLTAKPAHWASRAGAAEAQPRCDVGCAACGLRGECLPRTLSLGGILNETASAEALSSVVFGLRGVWRTLVADEAEATVTETLETRTVTFSLPTGTATHTASLTQSLSGSESATVSVTETPTPIYYPTGTASHTATHTETVTLPTGTATETLSLPTGTATLTLSESSSVSDTLSQYSSTLSTLSLTLTIPTATISLTLPTATASLTLTFSATVVSPSATFSDTLTLTLPSATETVTLTEYSYTSTHTATVSLSLPTATESVVRHTGTATSRSTGITAAHRFVHGMELGVFPTRTVRRVAAAFADFEALPSGKLFAGNFETAGEAGRCADARHAETLCLAQGVARSTGAVHLSSPLDARSRTISVRATFGAGGGPSGHEAGGSWVIAVHGVGPVLGSHGTGFLHGLANTDWADAARGVFVVFDATLADAGAGGGVLVLADGFDGAKIQVNTTADRVAYPDVFAAPDATWSAWVDIESDGRVKVWATANGTHRPATPAVEATLPTPLDALLAPDGLEGAADAAVPAYISVAAASGCGEVVVSLKAGFYMRADTTPHPYTREFVADHYTEFEVRTNGETLRFGFKPGKVGGDARVIGSNGTELLSGHSMGWTPRPNELHTVTITFRTGGVHTFSVLSYDGEHAWSQDFPQYGLWTANNTPDDVRVIFNSDGGYIWKSTYNRHRIAWWKRGWYDLTAAVGELKLVADRPRFIWHAALRNSYHKAALEAVSCNGVQHHVAALAAEAFGAPAPAAANASESGAAVFVGDPSRFLYSGPALRYYFPGRAFAVDFWVRYADVSVARSGLLAYTRPFAAEPDFQIVDEGSQWRVSVLREEWAVTAVDDWSPLSPLEPALRGYRCANSETNSTDDIVGASFSSQAACERFCANSRSCAACTPYRCDALHQCLCSYRALRRCVDTAVLPAGCTQRVTSKKRPQWVHAAFRWRASDGCWALLRGGRVAAQGCGLAQGRVLNAGGNLVVGQRVGRAGETDASAAFDGAFAHLRLWDGFPSDEELSAAPGSAAVAAEWPLTGHLDDVSGNARHMQRAGAALSFAAGFEAPLEAVGGGSASLRDEEGDAAGPAGSPSPPLADGRLLKLVTRASFTHSSQADVDGDGAVDTVVGDDDTGVVSWLTGAGGHYALHTIGSVVEKPAGCRLGGVGAADLNGDGAVDVYAACGHTVSVWHGEVLRVTGGANQVRFTLSAVEVHEDGGGAPSGHFNGVCVADVDGDAVDDIVVSFADASLTRRPGVDAAGVAGALVYRLPLDSAKAAWGVAQPEWVAHVKVEGAASAYMNTTWCVYDAVSGSVGAAGKLTWAAWLRPVATLANSTVLELNTSTSAVAAVDVAEASGSYYAECRLNGESTRGIAGALEVGVWYHVVCVWDQDALTLQGYQNGQAGTAAAVSSASLAATGAASTVVLGCSAGDLYTPLYHGYIDDVRVYDAALSRLQVVSVLAQGLRLPLDAVADGLLADASAFARTGVAFDGARERLVEVLGQRDGAALDVLFSDGAMGGDFGEVLPDGLEQVTLAAWVLLPAGTGVADGATGIALSRIVAAESTAFGVYYDKATGKLVCVFQSHAHEERVASAGPLRAGEWVHVACTYNGAAAEAASTAFVDMANQGYGNATALSGGARLRPPAGERLVLGGGDFAGQIDDVRVLYTAVAAGDFVEVFEATSALAYHVQEDTILQNTTDWLLPGTAGNVSGQSVGGRLVIDASQLPVAEAAARTVSLWLYPTEPLGADNYDSGGDCLVVFGAPSLGDARERICVSRTAVMVSGKAWFHFQVQGGELPVGEWTHLAFRYTGTHASVFVNGERLPPHETALSFSTPWRYDVADMHVGGGFTGRLRDVRVYSTDLTAADLRGLYAGGAIAFVPGAAADGGGGGGGAWFGDAALVRDAEAGRLSGVVAACVDIDSDGDIDVVVSAQPGATAAPPLSLLKSDGLGRFARATLVPAPRRPSSVVHAAATSAALADVSADYMPDVLATRADGVLHTVLSSNYAHSSSARGLCTHVLGNASLCSATAVVPHGAAAARAGFCGVVRSGGWSHVVRLDAEGSGLRVEDALLHHVAAVASTPDGTLLSTRAGTFLLPADGADATAGEEETDGGKTLLLSLRLDERHGRHVRDSASGGSHAVLHLSREAASPEEGSTAWSADAAGVRGLYFNTKDRVGTVLSLSRAPAAVTLSAWVKTRCARAEGTVVSVGGVLALVAEGRSFYAAAPGATRRRCGARLDLLACGGGDRAAAAEWHLLAATWRRGEGFRVFLDGRSVLACGAETVDEPREDDDARAAVVDVGGGFHGVIRDVRVYGYALSEAEVLAAYDGGGGGGGGGGSSERAVPHFAPRSVGLCPGSGGWQEKPGTGGAVCARAVVGGNAGLRRLDAAHLCRARGVCSWSAVSGTLRRGGVFGVHAAPLEACRSACCDDTACAAFAWHRGRCSLAADARFFAPASSGEAAAAGAVWLRVNADPEHHFAFDDATASDAVSNVALTTPDGSVPAQAAGVEGLAVQLADGQSLGADVSLGVAAWTLSVWARQVRASNETRCHFSLSVGSFSMCAAPGGLLLASNADAHFVAAAAVVDDTAWHRYEAAYDGRVLHFARDCAVRSTVRFNTTHVGGSAGAAARVYVGGRGDGSGADAGGTWAYDELRLWRHFSPPCGAAHVARADLGAGGRLAAVDTAQGSVSAAALAGSASSWVRGTYRWPHGHAAYGRHPGCAAATPWPMLQADGVWRCGGRAVRAAAACEADAGAAGTAAAASAPLLHATLDGAFTGHGGSEEWTTLLRQDAEAAGYFPRGRYTRHGEAEGAAHLYLNLEVDWRRYRRGDSLLELRLSFPRGACDGTPIRDVVWRQRSLPGSVGAVEGYEAVDVPYATFEGAAFAGLSRGTDGRCVLDAGFEGAYGVGAHAAVGDACGLEGPDARGAASVRLSVRLGGGGAGSAAAAAAAAAAASPVTVAFWVRARAEPAASASWRTARPRGCEGRTRTHPRAGRAGAAAAAWADGARRASLSYNRAALPGGVWTCAEDNLPAGANETQGQPEGWQGVRLGTRRYGLFSYWREGQALPDLSMRCEGEGAARGSCEIVAGQPTASTVNGHTYVNSPQLVLNRWAGGEWQHFALSWEGRHGCYRLYLNSELVDAACGHNVGGAVAGGGVLTLGHAMASFREPEANSAVFGAVADFALWDRVLSPDEVRGVHAGTPAASPLLHYPLRAPRVLSDAATGRYDLRQDGGAFARHVAAPPAAKARDREGQRTTLRLPGRRAMSLWTGPEELPFTDGAGGATVCFWHKSTDEDRAVFAYSRVGSSLADFALVCQQRVCRVELAASGADSVEASDVLLSAEWRHGCVAYDGTSISLHVDGAAVALAMPSAVLVAATANVSNADAGKVIDGQAAQNGTLDERFCYNTGRATPDTLTVELRRALRVVSVHIVGAAGYEPLQVGWSVYVGMTGTSDDALCASGVSLRGGGPRTVTCERALAGRYVTLNGADGLIVCEVSVAAEAQAAATLPLVGVFRVGGYATPTADALQMDGSLADVRVWTRGLSKAEVLAEYHAARPVSEAGLWSWWQLDTLRDAAPAGKRPLQLDHTTGGQPSGVWELVFEQVYPGGWDGGGLERVRDGVGFASLARLAHEHRGADGRIGLRLAWADLQGEEVWWQTSDPTRAGAVDGFGATGLTVGGGFAGLVRGGDTALMVGSGNFTGVQYAVGTHVSADAAAAHGRETSQDVRLYARAPQRCVNLWTSRLDMACGAAYIDFALHTLAACKTACRSVAGCTGFSYPCEAGATECCRVHAPGTVAPRLLDASFSLTTEGGTATALSAGVVRPGAVLWEDVNMTSVPPEMLGATHAVLDVASQAEGSTYAVRVLTSASLYVVFNDYQDGGLLFLLNSTRWSEVLDPVATDNTTHRVMMTTIAAGDYSLPVTTSRSMLTLAVQELASGAEAPDSCSPEPAPGIRYYQHDRLCDGQHERVSDTQCYEGAVCEECLAETGFRASLHDCYGGCAAAEGCAYFTFYENGWCSLLPACKPYYVSALVHRGGCVTHRITSDVLGFTAGPKIPEALLIPSPKLAYRPAGNAVAGHPMAALDDFWPSQAFTVEWWMKPSQSGGAPLSFTSVTQDGFAFEVVSGFVSAVVIADVRVDTPLPGVVVSSEEWTHVAVTWVASSGVCQVILNGQSEVWCHEAQDSITRSATQASFVVARGATIVSSGNLRVGQYFSRGAPSPVKVCDSCLHLLTVRLHLWSLNSLLMATSCMSECGTECVLFATSPTA